MRFEAFSFGSICIDGTTYGYDVVIDRGRIRKRKKKRPKGSVTDFGHTPLSIEEEIPWKCRRLVIGTGTGALPVMEEVNREAHRRNQSFSHQSRARAKIKLQILPTAEAIKTLEKHPERTNTILHGLVIVFGIFATTLPRRLRPHP